MVAVHNVVDDTGEVGDADHHQTRGKGGDGHA